MSNSRRQRRQLAKNFGLLGKEKNLSEKRERFRRSNEMGQQFHLRHLEENMNSQLEEERKRNEVKILESSLKLQEENSDNFVLSSPDSFDFLKNQTDYSDVQGSDE
jgi:hypothetical protein